MADVERWITVHPNGADSKGQPIPVMEGQSKGEAIKSFKHKDKNIRELKNEQLYDLIGNKSTKIGKVYSDEEIENIVIELAENYTTPERGKEDLNLKKVLMDIGYDAKPLKLKKEEFAKVLIRGKIVFRGLHGEDSFKHKEDFYNGEMFVGTGLGGNGIYVSQDKTVALSYAQENGSVICAIVPKEMKIAGKECREDFKIFIDKIKTKYAYNKQKTKEENIKNSNIMKCASYGIYCALKGYDGYLPTINPEKNFVILNRGKLVIGENNEQEYFLE